MIDRGPARHKINQWTDDQVLASTTAADELRNRALFPVDTDL
jgi:hypothetical protein